MCIFAALGALGTLFGAGGGAAGGLGTALQAVGTAVGAFGSIAGGIQANNVAKYNAKVAENNATAENQRAAYEAGLQRDQLRRVVGAQRAAGAASGLDTQSGTPLVVLGDSAREGELDILARLYSGQASATAYRNDAARMRAEGKSAQMGGFINAGTSLLSGFGKMAASRRYAPLAGR